jgi:hypothetical protein
MRRKITSKEQITLRSEFHKLKSGLRKVFMLEERVLISLKGTVYVHNWSSQLWEDLRHTPNYLDKVIVFFDDILPEMTEGHGRIVNVVDDEEAEKILNLILEGKL